VRHKLYDLDHRKYDAATAQFLSVDPLWSMFISSGSYVYCTGDAINNVDPWGLSGSGAINPDPSISTFNDEGIVGASPFIVSWWDDYLEASPLAAGKDNSGWLVRILDWRRGLSIGVRTEEPIMIPYLPNTHRSKKTPGKGDIGYWSGRGATPETAVQLKEVTVTAMRIPRTTWDAITTARILTLDERVQQPAFDFVNAVETELGVRLRVSQARRSIEEQNRIWQMGRDANGRKVGVTYTNVKGGMSAHNFGLAIDVVIYPKVNTAIPVSVAQIGQRYGFEWGGRWSDPKDYPHFQMFWINGRGPR
jgi:hypothetical protein